MPKLKDDINNNDTPDPSGQTTQALLGQAKDQAQALMADVDARQDDATNTTAGGNVGDDRSQAQEDNQFLQTLQDRLLDQSGMVSSSDTDLQATIQDAVSQAQTGREAGAERIRSRFQNRIQEAQQEGVQQATTQREQTGGFATQLAALRNVTEQTDDRIADLERQREQALLQNRSDAANRIQDLIVREQEMEQQARQNTLSNLFQGAQLAQGQQQFQTRMGQQQTQFEQRQERLQEQQDFEQARSRIELLNNSGILSQADEQQLRDLESQIGLPSGTLDKIKDEEEMNLSTVSGVGLVNVSRDEEGNVQSEIIVPAQDTGTGSDGGFSVSLDQSAINRLSAEGFDATERAWIQALANNGQINRVLNSPNLSKEKKTAIKEALGVDESGGSLVDEVGAELESQNSSNTSTPAVNTNLERTGG